jgi:type II secretory pathway pseudopilin PulG
MIDTKLLRRWRAPGGLLGRSHARREGPPEDRRGLAAAGDRRGLAGEEGLTLIEVMVSALMVGFIAIATFNGLTVATDATASERFHDQASLLAAQSQESLRSDSAATLDAIEESAHVYTQTIGGETYTISQSDKWVQDANQNASCSATGKEHSNAAGNYLQIHTRITWPQQLASGAHPLEQYSIITPPDGSGLEVDVTNGLIPEKPVAGVTVKAGEAESTTGEAGCVIFGGIPATRVNVEAFKIGDVTQTGAIRKDFPELLVVPNLTTQVPVTLNQGAAITAEFTHEGKAVTGDTFVASNAKLEPSPDFEVGSTQFGSFGKEGEYDALPAGTGSTPYTQAKEAYLATAKTPISTVYYPSGDLFPYESAWTAYAGDCLENNPHTVDPSQFPESSVPSVTLTPGEDATVKIPTSYVLLNAYSGTKSVPGSLEGTSRPVKITNNACASSKTPDNASAFSTIHLQNTTIENITTGVKPGHLEAPYQPFGKVVGTTQPSKLCLWDEKEKRTYTAEYANETIAGSEINLYLKEPVGEFESTPGHKVKVKEATTDTC